MPPHPDLGRPPASARWRTPATWMLVSVAMLVALLAWAVASPIGASPDEDYHLASAWCGAGERPGLCEPGDTATERRVPEALLLAPCYAFDDSRSGACPLPPSSQLTSTDRGNYAHQYPPLFYAAMSIFAGPDLVASVITMRAANAVLFVALLLALVAASPAHLRALVVWPAAVVIVPLGMFLVPSVNPSSWAFISACGVWLAVTGSLQAAGRRRLALSALAAAFTIIGAGARADAAVYAALGAVVAVLLNLDRVKSSPAALALPILVVLISGGFFLTSSQAASLGSTPQGDSIGVLVLANLVLLPELWAGALGTAGLGWLDTEMPGTVWLPVIFVFSALLFRGLRSMTRARAGGLALLAVALVALPLYYFVTEGAFVGTVVQPRYIYPLLVMLLGVALFAVRRDDLSLTRLQLALVAGCLVTANTVALHTNLRRYVTGADVRSPDLGAGLEWWWNGATVSPMSVWMAGSLAFAVTVVTLAVAARRAARPLRLGDEALEVVGME